MNKLSIIILAAIVSMNAIAQNAKGKQFPDLTGETFSGKTLNVPKDTKGKISVIGVCFSKSAEDELKTWLNPVYNTFIAKKDTNNIFNASVNEDVNFYFIPMLNTVNQVFEKGSKERIRNGTDKEFWPYLVFYTGPIKPYKEDFEIKDTKIPYFFVLDENGKILHVESGKYMEKKMENITEFF